jgi:hypothetical protein
MAVAGIKCLVFDFFAILRSEFMNPQFSTGNPAANEAGAIKPASGRSRLTLFLVIAVCAAPVILSYLSYYWINPKVVRITVLCLIRAFFQCLL